MRWYCDSFVYSQHTMFDTAACLRRYIRKRVIARGVIAPSHLDIGENRLVLAFFLSSPYNMSIVILMTMLIL